MKKWLACLLLACCTLVSLSTASASEISDAERYEGLIVSENMGALEFTPDKIFYSWTISCYAPLIWGVVMYYEHGQEVVPVYVDEEAWVLHCADANVEWFETAKADGTLISAPDEPGIWRSPDWLDLDVEALYAWVWSYHQSPALLSGDTESSFKDWVASMSEEELIGTFPLNKPYGHFWRDWLNELYANK